MWPQMLQEVSWWTLQKVSNFWVLNTIYYPLWSKLFAIIVLEQSKFCHLQPFKLILISLWCPCPVRACRWSCGVFSDGDDPMEAKLKTPILKSPGLQKTLPKHLDQKNSLPNFRAWEFISGFSHDVTKNSNLKTIDPTEILLLWCIRATKN